MAGFPAAGVSLGGPLFVDLHISAAVGDLTTLGDLAIISDLTNVGDLTTFSDLIHVVDLNDSSTLVPAVINMTVTGCVVTTLTVTSHLTGTVAQFITVTAIIADNWLLGSKGKIQYPIWFYNYGTIFELNANNCALDSLHATE